MNILFLSTENPFPPDCGHHLRTSDILKILAKRNKIYFVGFAQNEAELKFIPDLKIYCETVDIFLIPPKGFTRKFLTLMVKNLLSKHPLVAQRYFIESAQKRIQVLLENYAIDVVHVDMLALGLYRQILNGTPAILTNHNVESLRLFRWMKHEKNVLIKFYLFYQYWKLRRFEKTTCPQFQRCIVVSDNDRQYLKKLCQNDNFIVIPNGVNINYFKPSQAKKESNSLVWIGSMNGSYNSDAVDYFLEKILPLINEKISDVNIDFLGHGSTKKLAKAAAENPRLKIHGFVSDVRPIMCRAQVFIAPLRSGSGTKVKVLNALSLGKAVVTTPVGAEGIGVTAGEDILIAHNAQEFADKTIYLIEHPNEAELLGQKGRKLIEQFYDWQIIEKNIVELYQRVKM